MKNWLVLIVPLLLATLGCALSVASDGEADTRPVINEDRPAIVMLAPQTGERYALGTTLLLHAQARDVGSGVAKIEFYDNFDAVIGTVNAANPQGDPTLNAVVMWQPPNAQRHFIRAKAFRADGAESPLQEVSIEVVETSGSPAPAAQPTDLAPQQTEDVTLPQTITSLQAVVKTDVVNVRVAPGVDAGIAQAPLTVGTTITLVGRSADNLWFATPLAAGGVGWVFGEALDIQGDGAALPLAQ